MARLEMRGLNALINGLGRTVEAVLSAENQAIARDMKKSLLGPRTGRRSKRRGRIHQASAPGEAPAYDTGRLSDSIIADRFSVRVTAPYAARLELDLNRPFAAAAFTKATPGVIKNTVAALRDLANS